MKNLPFILPLTGLSLGIILAEFQLEFDQNSFVPLVLKVLFLIIALSLFWLRINTWLIFLLFIRIGLFLSSYQNQYNKLPDSILNQEISIKVKIQNIYKPSEKFRKYKAEILQLDTIPHENTAILLYWDRENPVLNPSDEVWIKTKVQPLNKPLNPYQFDYSKYLKRQKIHYRAYGYSDFAEIKYGQTFFHKIASFKRRTYENLQLAGYTKNSADIIGAMILGDRTEMDEGIQENYRKTGVVHILSISGLHIMVVYSLFHLLLYPVVYLKNGKIYRILLSLTLIWSYVLLVGFQPPVLRSALMISVFHITVTFRRKPNVYHTLCVTAFILLCFNTNFLFDVGFQLSYLAVFFIVYLHPVYQKIFRPKKYATKLAVGFFGTCLSAQIGTFPIAAFYFHQTSGLFLAGNLVMMMASNFMIAGGMLSIVFQELSWQFSWFISAFNQLIQYCNLYMEWLSDFDFLVFDRINFQFWEVLLLLGTGILIRFLFPKPKFNLVLSLLFLILIFQVQRNYRMVKMNSKKEIILFHQYKNSVMGVRYGKNLDVYIRNMSDSLNIQKYLIQPYEINENINKIEFYSMDDLHHSTYWKTKNLIEFEGKKILIAHQDVEVSTSEFDFIWIQENSKPKLDSLIKSEIILDGSNYPNHLPHQKEAWRTREKGAKIIPIP
jgi:competence protein ComEC